MKRTKVAVLLFHYPKISETYIRCEIQTLRQSHDVLVLSQHQAKDTYSNPGEYRTSKDNKKILEWVEKFKPQVLHGHWLMTLEWIHEIAKKSGIPYTIRTHSFDVIKPTVEELAKLAPLVRDPLCLGILGFPFLREKMVRAGFPNEKLVDAFPVANIPLFRNREPNGERVMNVGACLPKKKMEDFLLLGKLVPERGFDLYAMSYEQDEMKAKAAAMQSPITFINQMEPDDMPAEYKKHQWLVYTGCFDMKTVGWPLAVAEAQASGVGVCIANMRPDLKEYVGEAGYLYNSIEELKEIVSKPFSPEKRELGFKLAERSNFTERVSELTALWDKAKPGGLARFLKFFKAAS
jgi:hypothetical protein